MNLAITHPGGTEEALVVVPVLGGEDGGEAGDVVEAGVTRVLQLPLGLVGQLPGPELVLVERELEGGGGILLVLQTAREPGHQGQAHWLYLGTTITV